MANLSVPFLNRLVDQMLERADPKADQNIWDLARAAEEVFREVKGDPAHTAELGEIKRLLFAKVPDRVHGMSTRDVIDHLIQDHQAASQSYEQACRHAEALTDSLQECKGTLDEVRKALDPDDQFEAMTLVDLARERVRPYAAWVHELQRQKDTETQTQSLTVNLDEVREILDPDDQFVAMTLGGVARERMNQLAARKQELQRLHERMGTEIEPASAESLRRALGAGEHETLGQAARRVGDAWRATSEAYDALIQRDNNQFHELDDAVRKLVGAHDESESNDHYAPQQSTLDAVRRLVARLCEVDREEDGSRKARYEILADAQSGWIDDHFKELPAEDA